jgi:hypothetical protein
MRKKEKNKPKLERKWCLKFMCLGFSGDLDLIYFFD